jgi:hypothetical protein
LNQMQGITITKYTFNDPDLSWAERVLIEKIHLYDNDEKGCFASNKTLADFVGVKENSLANMLSSLTARNKISRISFDGKNRGYRSRLHPAKHISEPSQKSETSEEASQNNEGYPSQFYEASPEPSQKNDGNLHKKVIQEPSQKSEHIKKENKDEYLEKKELLKEKDISNEISKKKSLSDAEIVFEYWKSTCNHPKAKYSADKRLKIEARLAEKFTVDELKQAINGNKASPYHQGQNTDGKVFDSIDLIFRNATKTEGFIQIAENPPELNGAQQNGSNQKPTYPNKRTNADILAESADFYANYPN